ncbi:hypothetical protein Klosneuvirus_1_151 [Klosneuvirus KNV1]|uniref:Uncharacterized protein n=1 Tax=Klosneuvirus KNV1 TaxID=1977640 RepID=A0A1V0SI19_9VIRU|nr:hypothetical protein Klosneuvirus_1_151 [Klosneuvirus KNV1]
MKKYNIVDDYHDLNKSLLQASTMKTEDYVDIDIVNENELYDSKIHGRIILFDIQQFLEKIAISYNFNLYSIIQQYKSDFDRSTVYFNNDLIKDNSYVMDQLLKYAYYKINLYGKVLGLDTIILMICTQASFVFSFTLMHKLYSNVQSGMFVTSNKVKYNINIQNNGTIDIKLDADYNIKNVNNGTINNVINVVTDINIVNKNKKYEFSKWGIMSWTTKKI